MSEESEARGDVLYQQYEVRFAHGDFTLAGLLVVPQSPGKHPAVVMIQGSGAADRDNFRYFPPLRHALVRRGIAVLCYDKPGVGGSSGDWRQQSLHDRAAEAIAAHRFLQAQSGIAPGQVGLWGHSQGGWVVPLAAALSPEVSYTVIVSGCGVSPAEQEAYSTARRMRDDGFPEAQIAQAAAFIEAWVALARADAPFEQLTDLFQSVPGRPPYDDWSLPDAPTWAFLKRILFHDPQPALRGMNCPVLAIFGERDPIIPVAQSIATFEESLRDSGKQGVTIAVFPQADHLIRTTGSQEFAPGFLGSMATWILRQSRLRTYPAAG